MSNFGNITWYERTKAKETDLGENKKRRKDREGAIEEDYWRYVD